MPDGKSLASSVVGMDLCVRTFQKLTEAPLFEVVRMASLTPAQIAGWGDRIGSIAAGKFADFVVMDVNFNVRDVYIGGKRLRAPSPPGTPGGPQ